ncbi:MAG: M42 family metallopeptidase [bacterium]|nr:M42 family metallopeptidase [bacterium]
MTRHTPNLIDLELLEVLTATPAVSGHEDRIIDLVVDCLRPHVDSLSVDGIGNVLAAKGGSRNGPRLMIFAHMDEVGLCVKRIAPDGFLKVDRIGGINRKALVARPVLIHTESGESIPGTIGVMAHHLTPESERFKVPDIPQLYVDVGARTSEEVQRLGIKVGDPITYENTFRVLANNRIRARALDNRIGLYVLLKSVEILGDEELPCEFHAVGTVQEEFNVRGSLPAVRAIQPQAAICLDVAMSCDTPDLAGETDVRLGGGPVLKLMNFHGRGTLGGLIPNPRLRSYIERVAGLDGVPLQRQASIGGLTDASFLQLENHGIPAIDLGIPMRFSHSPVETVDLADVEMGIRLVVALVRRFDSEVKLMRGLKES